MLDTSPAQSNSGEFDSSNLDFSRLSRELDLSSKRDELEEKIDAGDRIELREVLAELYNQLRTQTIQYGAEGFQDTALKRDLARARNKDNPAPEAARLIAEHMSPREFESVLRSLETGGNAEVAAFQGFAKLLLNQVYGLARMTKQAALIEREIGDGYFASVTNDELKLLAVFYGPRSPEAPELISEVVTRIAKLNKDQDALIVGGMDRDDDLTERQRSARDRIFEAEMETETDSLVAAVTVLERAENTLARIRAVRESPDVRSAD